jgi:fumarylpyruvate hydrolase
MKHPFTARVTMTEFAFTPPATPSLAVFGSSARFPIRRVFCVGRNYATHAREMGSDPDREPPFFFMKPADAVVPAEGALPYPPATKELHHEIELVVALRSGGADIPADEALAKVWGYGVGIDLTRRDLQAVAKDAGRPWDMAKGFDASAPCTPLRPVSAFGHPAEDACIRILVNGEVRQDGALSEMIWPIADIISHLSRLVTLAPGDLIFTGTPGGVGALQPGDRVHGEVAGVDEFDLEIVEK